MEAKMADPNYTHIAFILDRSGSMETIADDMNGGIRTILKDEAKRSAQEGKLVLVDVTLFDYEVLHTQQSVSIEAADATIVPRGQTALYDAVGKTLVSLNRRLNHELPEEERPSRVLVIIVTDGLDNASTEWSAGSVAVLVEKATRRHRWEFLFLAANIDAQEVGESIGMSADGTIGFHPNKAGVRTVEHSIVGSIRGTWLDTPESAIHPAKTPTDPETTPEAPN